MAYYLVPPPCKNIKCISYPVCIHKKVIDCSTLIKYYEMWFKMEYPHTASHIWAEINKILPNVHQVTFSGAEMIRHPLYEFIKDKS